MRKVSVLPGRAWPALAASCALVLAGCSTADAAPVVAASAPASAVRINPSASTSSSGTGGTAATTYLVECVDGNLVRRPVSFTLSCGDSNAALDALAWTWWGATSAKATGTYVENTCDPSCADGKLARYPVAVVVSKPLKKRSAQVYTLLTITFSGTVPPDEQRVQTFPLQG